MPLPLFEASSELHTERLNEKADPKFECNGAKYFSLHDMMRTETDFGPPHGKRLTWTCRRCGDIWGRIGA